MGRPRKRRHVDEADEQQAAASASVSPLKAADLDSSSHVQFTPLPSGATFDMDYSALYDAGDYANMGGMDLPYCDFFSPVNGLPQTNMIPDYVDLSLGYTEPAFLQDGLQFGGVDLLGGINFDDKDPANEQLAEDITKQTESIMSLHAELGNKARQEKQRQSPKSPESIPSLSHNESSSDTTGLSTGPHSPDETTSDNNKPVRAKALPNAQCACLSQIYLALDALTRLPDDIIEAMQVARAAAKAAHDVIVCPICSEPYCEDVTRPPTMQSFQNTMLLGTLLPTTANAYIQILDMVETTTAEAKEKGTGIVFRLLDYGGLWGRMDELDKITCQTVEHYDNKEMNPEHWRLTIRALLKMDVYGFQLEKTSIVDGSHISHRHLGLKDVITAMEERSNRRHDKMDALVASGRRHPFQDGPYGLLQCSSAHSNKKEDRQCLKMIEMARVALDKLVIA